MSAPESADGYTQDAAPDATDGAVNGAAAAVPAASGDDDEVPPPPAPYAAAGEGPSERRARVEMPPPEHNDGPTYYRMGVDHEYEQGAEEIHFQCTRIKKLENLEAAGASLRKLEVIANCVEKIENLDTCVNLEHLELYQNLVKKIENISHLTKLNVLDLSFNRIRSTAPLADCPFENLEKLYLCSNKIIDIEGVFHLTNIKMLELGSNRIRGVPPELANLCNLEQLWLGKNKVVSMALPPLPKLQHLSLQNNRLEHWEEAFFHSLPSLTHLYMGHNALPDLPAEFALLTNIREVDLAKNKIATIRPLPELVNLEEFWMNDNEIADLAEVRNLAAFPALKCVYLERNPMHGLGEPDKEERYKAAITEALPGLQQLDAEHIGEDIQVITDGTERNVRGIRKR